MSEKSAVGGACANMGGHLAVTGCVNVAQGPVCLVVTDHGTSIPTSGTGGQRIMGYVDESGYMEQKINQDGVNTHGAPSSWHPLECWKGSFKINTVHFDHFFFHIC